MEDHRKITMQSVEIDFVLGTNWLPYLSWKKNVSKISSELLFNFVKDLAQAYQEELRNLSSDYESDKKRVTVNHTNIVTGVNKKQREDAINHQKEIESLKHKSGSLEKFTVTECQSKLNQLVDGVQNKSRFDYFPFSLIPRFNVVDYVSLHEKTNKLDQTYSMIEQNTRKLDEIIEEIRISGLKSIEEDAKKQLEVQQEKFNHEKNVIHDQYSMKQKDLRQKYRNIVQKIVDHKELSSHLFEISKSVPEIKNFICASQVPEFVYLGDLQINLTSEMSLFPEVYQFLLEDMPKIVSRVNDDTYLKVPFCQRLDEGISLFLNYDPKERLNYHRMLKNILLKLFMTFPAGRLEATFIDPLELGETFASFAKLGEEQSRIIDTKIWSQERDIRDALSNMRQKLETLTTAYGTDRAARFKKEPIRLLAVTDFPTGFSQEALRDLQAIVRKSATLGVIVMIWTNSGEMRKFASSQQSNVYDEIKQILNIVNAQNRDLKLENPTLKNPLFEINKLQDAETHETSIISTIAKGIHASQRKIEHFVDMFENIEDPNNWQQSSSINELSIPIGIKGADTVVKMSLGKTGASTEHHALIAGQTGAGKSTLLHTIIMSILLNYPPEEVLLYLVDFKEGVEFKAYTQYRLPSLRVIAIDSEREFGLNILKELVKELERRASLFSARGYQDISEYRKNTKNKVPKIVLVFDEVQELFREDSKDDVISKECLSYLNKLIMQGRALGIHIILACQDFGHASGLGTLFSQMAIRIAIKGSEESARSVLGNDNAGAKQLQDGAPGAAVYNNRNGVEAANSIFQVSWLSPEKRKDFLGTLSAIQGDTVNARYYESYPRILLTKNAEDDYFNVFNQFIHHRKIQKLFDDVNKYGIIVGEGFELSREFKLGLLPSPRSNLLLVGSDEKKAASMFIFIALSILFFELSNDAVEKDNQLIQLIDLSVEEDYVTDEVTNFRHLKSCFPNQIERAENKDIDGIISAAHNKLTKRMSGEEKSDERLFFMFFGINRAHKLVNSRMYDDQNSRELTTIEKLWDIFHFGSQYGINSVVWGERLQTTSRVMEKCIDRDFSLRIAFSTDMATMESLVMEYSSKELRHSTAVYMDIDNENKNKHFRPYEIPNKWWVNNIAEVYKEFENGGQNNE